MDIDKLTPELRLLLACSRVTLDPKSHFALVTLLAKQIDWELVFSQASRHGLLPLLHKHLTGIPEGGGVPLEFLARLKQATANIARNNLRMTAELLRVLAALDADGLTAVPIKGPLLAQTLYGSIALRPFSDLDILVDPREMHRIQELLAGLGYSPDRPDTDTHRELHLRAAYDYDFLSLSTGIRIEIHHRLDLPCFQSETQVLELLTRTVTIALVGKNVSCLSAEDQFLYLCVHGAKHFWERLEWICAIGEIVNAQEICDWTGVLSRARKNGTERTLLIGLLLAKKLIGIAVPEAVVDRANSDRTVHRLASHAIRRLADDAKTPTDAEWFFYNFQARGFTDKIRYGVFKLTTPSLADVAVVKLPKRLHALYGLFRPVRVLVTYGASLMRALRRAV